ncbi:hypothetical protein ACTA71_005041 [Dictyostelium dimigraforme]
MDLTIIDTPGIGDTRGVDQDKKNFENILNYISKFDNIDGICILLKPNDARANILSQYCFKGLLSQLHKSSCKNIVFCYTNSRGTFYQPGDSHKKIQEMVSSLGTPDLKYLPENIFCFDSESFRFLAALKQGIPFSDEQIKDFSNSWETSVKSTERLISYINSLTSHDIKNTVSLNNSRMLINTLTRPIVEITSMINCKVKDIETKKEEIKHKTNNIEELKKNLTVEYKTIERKNLPYPTTVCTNPGCCQIVKYNEIESIHYSQRCHEGCVIKGPTNQINCIDLKGCCAMDRSTLSCRQCKHGCHYTKHMHITYETYMVPVIWVDEEVKMKINKGIDENTAKQQAIESLEKLIKENSDEKEEIIRISSQLSFFLKENSITTYTDTVIEYLKICIELEDLKSDKSGKKSLQENLEVFQKQHDILQRNLTNKPTEKITAADVPNLIEKLKNLKHNGPILRKHIEGNETDQKKINYNPVFIRNTDSKKKKGVVENLKDGAETVRVFFNNIMG